VTTPSLIRRLREAAGVSPYDAARAYGVTVPYYLTLERNHAFTNGEGIKRVARRIGCRQTFFLRAYRDATPERLGLPGAGTGNSRTRRVESSGNLAAQGGQPRNTGGSR
jgi:transcriptional regulator with XRE-family HTH domain